MDNNDLYCSLAFNSISFGPHGGSRPCCAIDTYQWAEETHLMADYDNNLIKWFNNEDMVELRQDLLDGKWNPTCNLCKIREEAGQLSTRQVFNLNLEKIQQKVGRDYIDRRAVIDDLSNIFLLDVTVGNKCNSACIMCNENASSLFEKEQTEITKIPFRHYRNMNWFSDDIIPLLIDDLPNLKSVQFAGGEPTINDSQVTLLKRLIDQGKSKEVSLEYVTNLTGISDELLELWDQFGTKYITVSIDGVGPVNEYQRYPFTWKKVLEQFNKLKEIAMLKRDYLIHLSHTVTSVNIMTLPSLIKWWEQQLVEWEVEGHPIIVTALPHVQCVNNPRMLDPIYMPKVMKEDCRKVLSNFENNCDIEIRNKWKPAFDNIRKNVLDVEVDSNLQVQVWNEMKTFLSRLDKYRKRDILKYLPYMRKYW